ncbi:MAG: hypothetical protein K8H74_17825 [Notoacmeibacter sp.]|nr:hypothetical protein [Notoacmeibacter sp.]
MSRSIIINDTFTDTSLPVLQTFQQRIAGITGLLGWFTADASYLTLDGSSRVSSWACRASAGTTFDQATSGNRPLYQANQINGEPALLFDRVRPDHMVWSGMWPAGAGTAWSKVAVMRAETGVGAAMHVLSNNTDHALFVDSSEVLKNYIAGSGIGSGTGTSVVGSATAFHAGVTSFVQSTAKQAVEVDNNGPEEATGASSTLTLTTLYLGTANSPAASSFSGQVADIMLFNKDILAAANEGDLIDIYDYIATQYGLTV